MTPATPSHTLTSLSINCRVDVALLSLVTNRLPALRLLRGSRLYLGEDCSDKVWGVCELTLTQGLRAHDDILLCRLPRCQEGVKLTVRVERMELVSREEVSQCVADPQSTVMQSFAVAVSAVFVSQ